MKSISLFLILLFFCGCKALIVLTSGISLKQHNISDTDIINYTQNHYSREIAIAKLDSNYFLNISKYYSDVKDSIALKQLRNYFIQPLNCLFFDDSNKLVTAYSICDADYENLKLTWADYLNRNKLVVNSKNKNRLQYSFIKENMIILKNGLNLDSNKNNAILIWSKIGGRQTKYYFKEFYNYFKSKNYNVYVVNCDAAFGKSDFNNLRLK